MADDNGVCRASLGLDGELRQGADADATAAACLAAAEQRKDPPSQYMAGLIYERGIGREVDSDKAKAWYRRAANKGHAEAQLAMGRLSEKTNYPDWALAWYAKAALSRNQAAAQSLLRLKPLKPDEMWRANMRAIAIDDSFGGLSDVHATGSGIVIAEDVVVTNEHVVEGCTNVTVAPGIPAKVVAADAKRDLAILRTRIRAGEIATLAADPDIATGKPLLTGGYPGAGDNAPTYTVTEGSLSQRKISHKDEVDFWLLTNKIDPGNSGGPLVDEAGLVRGVVFASLPITGIVKKSAPKGGHEGMAIRLAALKGFLDEQKIAFRSAAAEAPMSRNDLDARLAGFTVLVTCFQPE
ncbi:tetratricopeptide repeat-containing serine protease family protein [Dongia mobilis]|uniref:tetratricopeptide repeat-containing serine protease family protein n=1 Tax=Dongia mobilis TaxID=578943 RepID=UPI001414F9A6|nr:tetratricopeptide repeat-containing serine protease family protein [Dongia mobilis]